MRKLFHKPKSGKVSKDFAEDTHKPPIPTPLYQKLATHGAHIHGAISFPVFQQSTTQIPSPTEDQWRTNQQSQEPVGHLPNPHSPPPPINTPPTRSNSFPSIPQVPPSTTSNPAPPRSSSPMSTQTMTTNAGQKYNRLPDLERKKPLALPAVGILSSLEPPRTDGALAGGRVYSDERERNQQQHLVTVSENGHGPPVLTEKEKKRGFWNVREKDKEKDREREQRERERETQLRKERSEREQRDNRVKDFVRRDDDPQAELTRMIGYLTATASEDWDIVLEVCERGSATEASAKEAVRALRREFKYGEPAAQLSAARLWAIMLRNSSEIFISQSTSRKFLDTLEDVLSSPKTSPVVRERLLEVVAAAAYASGSKKDGRNDGQGFKGLWKKVKPFDKPEEGVPFDAEDAMFQPPQSGHLSNFDVPSLNYREPSPTIPDSTLPAPASNTHKKRKSPSRNRIIPPDEDMRRLFQECKIGQGNAAVLSDALLRARPEDLKRVDVIKEFYAKCRASQELIYAQIPWATSVAERSRANKHSEIDQMRTSLDNRNAGNDGPNSPVELTIEEKLLAALLAANAELLEVLKQWEDLHRLAIERKVEDRSRKETRMVSRHRENENNHSNPENHFRVPLSRTPSPQSRPATPQVQNLPTHSHPSSNSDHLTYQQTSSPFYESDGDPSMHQQQNLAPPPAAPHGPRLPAPFSSSGRSRTPSPTKPEFQSYPNGYVDPRSHEGDSDSLSSLEEDPPQQPSAKALGKRKVVEAEAVSEPPLEPDSKVYGNPHPIQSNNVPNQDFENSRHPPVYFVYDAVAERTRQLMLESRSDQPQINGVH